MRLRALALCAFALAGCKRATSSDAQEPRGPYPNLEYRDSGVSEQTRVFLVAGGDDVANFGAEVVEQRRIWHEAGITDEQIACYYAKPTRDAWREDLAQYQAVLPKLAGCHAASPGRVLADLRAVAQSRPPWIYVYVSAHGVESLLELAERGSSSRLERMLASLTDEERKALDTAAIGLQAGPSPRLGEVGKVIRRWRSGRHLDELVFTPDTLRSALTRFPDDTKKIVVLQACFSGGFIAPPRDDDDAGGRLTDVDNLVVLTATAADRPSFGCDSGSKFTYFGGAYNGALVDALEAGATLPDLDWPGIYERASFAVRVMESVNDERPSLPGFFSTAPAPSTPD